MSARYPAVLLCALISVFAFSQWHGGQVAAAEILENRPSPFNVIAPFGETWPGHENRDAYIAQYFTVPMDCTHIRDLRFYLSNGTRFDLNGSTNAAPLPLRVLLTSVQSDGQVLRPGAILFETDTIVLPYLTPVPGGNPHTVDVAFPDIPVQEFAKYAFIVDFFSDANYQDQFIPSAIVIAGNDYEDAEHNGGFRVEFGPGNVPIGNRSDHLANISWPLIESRHIDMAYRVTLVPEPSTWGMLIVGAAVSLLIAAKKQVRCSGQSAASRPFGPL